MINSNFDAKVDENDLYSSQSSYSRGTGLLAQSDVSMQHFYSMSAQILKHRNDYYKILERTQKEDADITEWLIWFLQALEKHYYAHRKLRIK